ncbi:transcription factor grauzone [Aedes aegypti]|uniref:C2H2-type domain-containing protein n=1 Tax=Aedes aegypti TaxID=7159 RepID=A0A6I8TFY8_AEDAE|nr:transcription factor grauzone [Aedes aegypti]
MDCSNCFTCGQIPAGFYLASNAALESRQDISHILGQHFWFQEDDLLDAIVCGACWAKVDEFHRFYQEVKLFHEQQMDSKPLSICIKQEEIEIVEQLLPDDGLYASEECEKPHEEVDCKLETKEICNELLLVTENIDSKPLKPYTLRKPLTKKKSLLNPARKRNVIPLEQQKAEDDFIKQHRPYLCTDCYVEFDSFTAIRSHSHIVHGKKYIVCCGTQQRTRSMLYEHVQNLLNPEAIRCEVCSKTFKSQGGYIRHKDELHPEEEQLVFKCHRCPKSFPKQKLLKRHVAEHETLENETAKCNVCGKCFRAQLSLRRHIIEVHGEKSYDFVCEHCSRRFARLAELKTHRKIHELTVEQTRKQCPVCNKWLKNLKYWRRHVQSHQEHGQYQCDRCDHVSVNLLALKRHAERKHNNTVKRYPCEVCGKEYSRPVTLKEHIANAHTGEPLYQCPYCEKKFFSNATMYAHKKKDHPELWKKDRMRKYAPIEKEKEAEEDKSGEGTAS